MSASDPSDSRGEALELSAALAAHLRRLRDSGATGLPRSQESIGPSVSEPPASMAPPVVPASTRPEVHVMVQVAPETQSRSLNSDPERLLNLATTVSTCRRCRLHETRKQTVFARGTGTSGLCFVGEGPGADEDEQGEPFVGKAGQLLDRMIAAMGMSREEVYVCNIVKCRPPENRRPEPDEIAACKPYLEEQLQLVGPKVIVALGATALRGLLGIEEGITRLRGKWKLYQGNVAVMPTFHPAYLLRNPSAKHAVWQDMLAVLRQLGRALPPGAGKAS